MPTSSTKCVARSTYSVFVGHLLQSTTKKDLFEVFKTCGKITEVFVFDGSEDAYKYGFVRFVNRDSAIKATQELNKWPLKGTPMIVDISKETKQKMQTEGFLDMSDEKSYTNQDVRSRIKESNSHYIDDVINLSRLKESCSSFNREGAQSGSQRSINIDKLLDDIDTVNCGICSTKAELIDYNPIDLLKLSKKLRNGELGKMDQDLTEKETQEFFLALEVIMDSVKGFTTFCRRLNSQETSQSKKRELQQEAVEDDLITSSPLDPAQVKANQLEDGLKQLLFSKKKVSNLSLERSQENIQGHDNTDKEFISRLDDIDYSTENLSNLDNAEKNLDFESNSEDEEFDDLRSCFHLNPNQQGVFTSGFRSSDSEDLSSHLDPSLSLEIVKGDLPAGPSENLSESPQILSLTELFHSKTSVKANSGPKCDQNRPPTTVSLQDLLKLKKSERNENHNKAIKPIHKKVRLPHGIKVKTSESLTSNNKQIGILGPAPNSLSLLGPVPILHNQQNGLLGPAPKFPNNHNDVMGHVPGYYENQNRLSHESLQKDSLLGPIPNLQSTKKGILGPVPDAKTDSGNGPAAAIQRSTINQTSNQKPLTSLIELPCDEPNAGEKSLSAMSLSSLQSSRLFSPSRSKILLTHSGHGTSSMKSGGRGISSCCVAPGDQKLSLNSLSSLSSLKSTSDTSSVSSDMSFNTGVGRGRGVPFR